MSQFPAHYFLPLIVILLLFIRFRNYFRSVIVALQLDGPRPVPLLGNVALIQDSRKLEELSVNMSTLYGPIVRVWVSIVPFFIITEPRHLQLILSKDQNSTKSFFYRLLHNSVGQGLTTITGRIWKEHRKMMQPHFQMSTMQKTFYEEIHKYSKDFVRDLKVETDNIINVIPHANKFVLRSLHDAVFGFPLEEDVKEIPFRGLELSTPSRIVRPWLLLDSLFNFTKTSKKDVNKKNVIKDYTSNVMNSKIVNTRKEPTSFIELFLETSMNNPDTFTETDAINETSTLMLAGQDSVGSALTLCFHYFAKYQEIQEKMMRESDRIFNGDDRETTFEDISEMEYLEQCIKEVLRLCPTVAMISRTLSRDIDFGKVTLPEGSNILIAPFATHRLPHIYQNPLEFNPDRFSPENSAKIQPYAYIPFSAGPRNCIGSKFAIMQLKTVLTEVLRRYHLSLVPGRDNLALLYRMPTLKASGGIWIKFSPRKH